MTAEGGWRVLSEVLYYKAMGEEKLQLFPAGEKGEPRHRPGGGRKEKILLSLAWRRKKPGLFAKKKGNDPAEIMIRERGETLLHEERERFNYLVRKECRPSNRAVCF